MVLNGVRTYSLLKPNHWANGKVFIGTAHDPISTPNPTGELDIYGLKN